MSIYFSGTFSRSSGVISAISKQLKLMNLKPVKKIEVKFDPFHPSAVTARDFLYHMSNAKIADTNLNCAIKANVVCDRSEPVINIDLLDSGKVKFLAGNLSVVEILRLFNEHISSTVKLEEEISPASAKLAKKKKLKHGK